VKENRSSSTALTSRAGTEGGGSSYPPWAAEQRRVEQRGTMLGVADDVGAACGGEVADARNQCPA
jgi:hypothetical protein